MRVGGLLSVTVFLVSLVGMPRRDQSVQYRDMTRFDCPNCRPASTSQSDVSLSIKQASGPAMEWYKDSNWWVVIVAGVTAFVIGWQSFETRRSATASQRSIRLLERQASLMEQQTEALQKSLRVAERTADSSENSERARLHIKFSTPEPFVLAAHALNGGRSPARLTYALVLFYNLEKGKALPAVPPYDLDDKDWVDDERWILPMESTPLLFKDMMSVLDARKLYGPQICEEWEADRSRLCVFGVIRYVDAVSNSEKRIQFCQSAFWNEDGTVEMASEKLDAYDYED